MQARQGLYIRLPVEIKHHGYCIRCKTQKISAGYSLKVVRLKKRCQFALKMKILTLSGSHSYEFLNKGKEI